MKNSEQDLVKIADCKKCKRIDAWMDNRRITPDKLDRYSNLLEFVEAIADSHQCDCGTGGCVWCEAKELLEKLYGRG